MALIWDSLMMVLLLSLFMVITLEVLKLEVLIDNFSNKIANDNLLSLITTSLGKLHYLQPHHGTIINLSTEGDILMLCQTVCINCNSNLDHKNLLPCLDLNPQPLWYLSNV